MDTSFENWCNTFKNNQDRIDRDFVIYMHQFEHRNSDTEQKTEYFNAYDIYRQQRLANYTHTYVSKIMNFSLIKTHLKPRYYQAKILQKVHFAKDLKKGFIYNLQGLLDNKKYYIAYVQRFNKNFVPKCKHSIYSR